MKNVLSALLLLSLLTSCGGGKPSSESSEDIVGQPLNPNNKIKTKKKNQQDPDIGEKITLTQNLIEHKNPTPSLKLNSGSSCFYAQQIESKLVLDKSNGIGTTLVTSTKKNLDSTISSNECKSEYTHLSIEQIDINQEKPITVELISRSLKNSCLPNEDCNVSPEMKDGKEVISVDSAITNENGEEIRVKSELIPNLKLHWLSSLEKSNYKTFSYETDELLSEYSLEITDRSKHSIINVTTKVITALENKKYSIQDSDNQSAHPLYNFKSVDNKLTVDTYLSSEVFEGKICFLNINQELVNAFQIDTSKEYFLHLKSNSVYNKEQTAEENRAFCDSVTDQMNKDQDRLLTLELPENSNEILINTIKYQLDN